jgi:branched-chain amino acid transport system substrate-binding protein
MVRRWVSMAVVLVSLLGPACGTRRSHEDVVSAAGGGASLAGSAAATSEGDLAAGGTVDETSGGDAGSASGTGGAAGSGSGAGAAGGSRSSGASGGSGSPGAKSTIRIGSVGTLSGPAGASLKPLTDGVRLWVRFINDKGGVNGHKVELVTADDGGDPSRHRALVQEFVEQRKVLAFVANPEALTGPGSVDYLTKAGVPVVGSELAGQYFNESPTYFPQGSHGNVLIQSSVLAVAAEAKRRGFTKVAGITCVEVQVCRDSRERSAKAYKKHGMEVVYSAESSLGQPDFTSECLNAQRAGAEIIGIGMDANAIRNIAASCARQNYRPMFQWTTGSAIGSHKDDPNLEGSLVTSGVMPWVATGTPFNNEFQAALAKYSPGTEAGGGLALGWVAAKVFERGAAQLPEPATRQALLDGLWAIHGDIYPDLTGPLLFNKGQPATPTVCSFGVLIRGKKWVAAGGGNRDCADFDPTI